MFVPAAGKCACAASLSELGAGRGHVLSRLLCVAVAGANHAINTSAYPLPASTKFVPFDSEDVGSGSALLEAWDQKRNG